MATSALAITQRLPGGSAGLRLWAIRAANLLLIALCAITAAQLFWVFWPVAAEIHAPVAPGNNQSNTVKTVNMSALYSSHLFGRADITKADTPKEAPVDAPETRLNLTLTGIMAASGEDQSRALIKDGSGKQRPYGIGDDIPGGAKLTAIHSDRVILERGGRYETLRMEKKESRGASNSRSSRTNRRTTAPLPGQAPTLTAETAAKVNDARQKILQDPTKASQYIRVQPVYNQGQLKGYRVYPGKDRQLFKDVGLRAGELLTSVNGVQLDDPTKALQMLTDLSQASEVNITLERAGQSRSVNINLNQ